MRFQLALSLAVSLMLQAGAFAQDVDKAAKDTSHATAKATKDAAHGTAEAAEKTTDAKPSYPHGMHSSTQHACLAVILPRLGARPRWRS